MPSTTKKNSVARVWKCTGAPAAPFSKRAVLTVSAPPVVSESANSVITLPGASARASAAPPRVRSGWWERGAEFVVLFMKTNLGFRVTA